MNMTHMKRKEKIVTTSCGKKKNLSEVKRVKGKYYIPNETIFLLPTSDGSRSSWVRIDSPLLAFDVNNREYNRKSILKDQNKVEGYYTKNDKGYFSINKYFRLVFFAFLNFYISIEGPGYAI